MTISRRLLRLTSNGDLVTRQTITAAVLAGLVMIPAPARAQGVTTTWTNPTPVVIPDRGPADVYPLELTVQGLTGAISHIAVRLHDLSHTFPGDVDVLLVGPRGQRVMLMSDAFANEISGATLTFDDGAPVFFSDGFFTIETGTYAPADFGGPESLPAPAPAGPHPAVLAVLSGTDPNGVWQLYVHDDASFDEGSLGAFSLIITTRFDSSVAVPILDNDTTESLLVVHGLSEPIGRVSASFHIAHGTAGDLNVSLVGPDGTTVPLTSGHGGSEDNYGTSCEARTAFADTASTLIADGTAPFVGAFRPEGMLAAFTGKSGAAANGIWRLRIQDTTASEAGTLLCWSLAITGHAPATLDDGYTTRSQVPLTIAAPGVLGNDVANPGSGMTASLIDTTANGTLVLAADGSFTYTPDASFIGVDTFTYQAVAASASGPTTVSITVNDVPTTVAEAFLVPFNARGFRSPPGVLANDHVNFGGPLSAGLVSTTTHGLLEFHPDGSFFYTSPPDFIGEDAFTYRAVNARGPGNVVTVRLTVRTPTRAPTASDDVFATPFETPVSIAAPGVLANDNTHFGGTMTVTLVSTTANGVLVLATDGSFTYTPNPGFAGEDTFTYAAANLSGNAGQATVSLTVEDTTTTQPPTVLRASSIDGDQVTLRWQAPRAGPAPTGYVIEGGVQPGEVLATIPTGSAVPIFSFTAPTGSFHVRVRSLAGGMVSRPSIEIPLHVNVPVPPSAPAGLVGLVNGSTIDLAWRNTFAGGAPETLLLDVIGAATLTVPVALADAIRFTDVPAGTYTLSLRAANGAGASGASDPITLTLPRACSGPPLTPANVLAYATGATLTALWDPATTGPAATGYVLQVSGPVVGNMSTLNRVERAAVPPGTYGVSVFATNVCGVSAPTEVQVVTVP